MLTFQDLNKIKKSGNLPSALCGFVEDYKRSEEYRTALEAIEYWKNRNPTINKYQKLLYTVSGNAVPDNYSADYKLSTNAYFRFVTQTVQYILGKGVSFENPETKKRLGGTAFDIALQNALTDAINGGTAYGLMNYDRLEVFGAEEFLPIYDEENGGLMAGIRFWQLEDNRPLRLTLYEQDGYTEYISREAGELEAMGHKLPYVRTIELLPSGEERVAGESNYGTLPIVPLYSPRKQSFIVGFKKLIDCHDLISSGYANDIDDASLIYWTITNAGGMDDIDLSRFLQHMRTVKAAVVEDDGAKAEAHTLNLPYQSREAILDRLESEMYKDFMIMQPNTITAGRSTTATAIKAAYEPMNLFSNMLESGLTEFVGRLLKIIGISDNCHFTRATIVNDLETARTVQTKVSTALMLRELLGDERVKEMVEKIIS